MTGARLIKHDKRELLARAPVRAREAYKRGELDDLQLAAIVAGTVEVLNEERIAPLADVPLSEDW